MNTISTLHPDKDLNITREELIKGHGYLVHFELSDGKGWHEWICFIRFTGQSSHSLEWQHEIA